MPREMIENEAQRAIMLDEVVEEKVSLSDRFGLWLGFHPCPLETYLAIVDAYATYFKLAISKEDLHQQAFQWAQMRGARSGRVAWQFMQDVMGRKG
jgi:predicted AAA+ superfamily ATPase